MKKIILSMVIATAVILCTPMHILASLCVLIVVAGILCTLFGLFAVPIYYALNCISKLYNNKAGTEGREQTQHAAQTAPHVTTVTTKTEIPTTPTAVENAEGQQQ